MLVAQLCVVSNAAIYFKAAYPFYHPLACQSLLSIHLYLQKQKCIIMMLTGKAYRIFNTYVRTYIYNYIY